VVPGGALSYSNKIVRYSLIKNGLSPLSHLKGRRRKSSANGHPSKNQRSVLAGRDQGKLLDKGTKQTVKGDANRLNTRDIRKGCRYTELLFW